jgi:glyceraldehyde-3-phosphate dehydrogenase type I
MVAFVAPSAALVSSSSSRAAVCSSAPRAVLPSFSGMRAVNQAADARLQVSSAASADDALAAARAAVDAVRQTVTGPTMSVKRVAINGFGRIGRNVVRCLASRENPNIEIVCINDTSGVKTAAHLLKYDSILGTFGAKVEAGEDSISVNGKSIKVVSNRDPLQLPWAELNIDIVIEGTGVFVDKVGCTKHLTAGAKKVVITSPGKGDDVGTFVMGVNDKDYKDEDYDIISNASCTTNCMAPFMKVLDDEFGVVKGTMTTTHSYTGDQRLLDAGHRDLRRARSAALNIVPTTTGAAKAVALVVPSLAGKLNGIALRVPTPNVSVCDVVCIVEKKTFKEEVNGAFLKASQGSMKGILKYCDEPLVSMDHRGTDESTIVDASLTMVVGDDMVKVVSWYDNEWGYSQRVVGKLLPPSLLAPARRPLGRNRDDRGGRTNASDPNFFRRPHDAGRVENEVGRGGRSRRRGVVSRG